MSENTTPHHYLTWNQETPTLVERVITALRVARWGGASKAWERAIYTTDVDFSHHLRRCKWSAKDLDDWTIVKSTHVDILANTLLAGANPNAKENNNYYDHLLHRMASAGQYEVVELLLDLGAQTDVRCGNQFTPLGSTTFGWGVYVADWEQRKKVIDLFLKRGVDASVSQGSHDVSLLARAPMDMALFDQLAKAGAPAQWEGLEFLLPPNQELTKHRVEQNILARFDEIGGTPNELNTWLNWATRQGIDVVKPFDNSHLVQREEWLTAFDVWIQMRNEELNKQQCHKALDIFEQHGFDLTHLGPNGRTIWHALLNIPNVNTPLWFEACLERPNLAQCVGARDHNGVDVFEMIDDTIENKKSHNLYHNDATIEGLLECKAMANKMAITQEVEAQTISAHPSAKRRM